MKYYIYKLECQGHTNHVIADENGPDYKCKSTRGDEILMSSEPDEKAKQLRLAGDFQFSMCLFQGCTYYYFRSLALAMHIPPKKLRSRLIRYRLWLEPWPKDLVEFVGGEPLPHLKFRNRNAKWVLANDSTRDNDGFIDTRDPRCHYV